MPASPASRRQHNPDIIYETEHLDVGPATATKRLPELLTETELVAFYATLWQAQHLTHGVMLKLLLFTGIRNAELLQLRLTDIDLHTCQVRVTQGKGHQDRYALFPQSFRGELAQYLERQRTQRATYLFETNRHQPYSTRRLRQIVKYYALEARITKRVYPHLFRHQLITYLTKQGIISPKLQLLSGHRTEQRLAVYRALSLADVAEEYEAAMRVFPVR